MRACGLFSGIPSSTAAAADVSQRLIKVVEILISLASGRGGRRRREGKTHYPTVCVLSMWVSVLFLPPLSRMFVRPSFLSLFPLSTANECDHTKLIGRPTSFLFFFLPHSTAFYLPFMSPISPPHQVRCLSNCVLIPERRGSGNESSFIYVQVVEKKPSQLTHERHI